MVYSQKQIKLIQKKRPDLRFQRIPTLDDLIYDFLKKFDVIIKPPNSQSNNLMDFQNYKKESYNLKESKLNQIKEWEKWKKWALDHSDFDAYRINKIKENQAFNKKILEKLNSDEVRDEFMAYFKNSNTLKNKLLSYVLIMLGFIFLYKFLVLIFLTK